MVEKVARFFMDSSQRLRRSGKAPNPGNDSRPTPPRVTGVALGGCSRPKHLRGRLNSILVEPDSIPRAHKEVLLIGCGAIGTVSALHLANHPSVHRLTLTDVDVRFAYDVAQRIGRSPKVRVQALDATDAKSLERTMKSATVAIQASVPANNARVQAACLATGTDYIDLAADSSDPYVASGEWERRGRIAIIGMGEDPGVSNLMARYSADRLDRVDSIRVRDGDSASSPDSVFLPLFSPETFIEETLNSSRIWENGKYREVPPFGETEIYDFPAPVGPQKVYSVDHEEVDSIPRYIRKTSR